MQTSRTRRQPDCGEGIVTAALIASPLHVRAATQRRQAAPL
jgi:hypothetical protein